MAPDVFETVPGIFTKQKIGFSGCAAYSLPIYIIIFLFRRAIRYFFHAVLNIPSPAFAFAISQLIKQKTMTLRLCFRYPFHFCLGQYCSCSLCSELVVGKFVKCISGSFLSIKTLRSVFLGISAPLMVPKMRISSWSDQFRFFRSSWRVVLLQTLRSSTISFDFNSWIIEAVSAGKNRFLLTPIFRPWNDLGAFRRLGWEIWWNRMDFSMLCVGCLPTSDK